MRHSAPLAALLTLAAAPAALAAPQVVTDLIPTGALVQEVMGDLGEVHVLLPTGASAHHYQMRPSDARALQSADLLVWVGPALTPWLARAAENASAAAQLRLLEVPGTTSRDYAGTEGAEAGHGDAEGHDHDHAAGDHDHADHDHADHDQADHDHDHDHDHGDHAGHDHVHTGADPHAWLDPSNAVAWLGAIAETLSGQDPRNAATYAANAEAAAARITALDADLRARLAPHAGDRFVVFHDAYGHFTDHFGLQPAIPVSLGDASTPSAARIEQIRGQIAQTGARCAFPEFAHDAALIDTVTEGSGVRIGAELSPEGGALPAGAGQYEALLTRMTEALVDCLSQE